MICVTGAGGTVGREVIKQLESATAPFRAAYFSNEKADAARARGIDAVIIDYNRPESLREAFQGCDKLFLLGPNALNQSELEQNAVEAAETAGVRHIVKQSVMGADGEAFSFALKRFSNRPCTTWGGRGTSARTDAGGPMRAYSMDLRERALLDSDAGMKAADVAAKYRVSGSWVRLLKQRRRETGEVAPRVQRHGRRCMLEPHLHTLAALIAAHPDRTLAELKDALATPASVPTVWRAVRGPRPDR